MPHKFSTHVKRVLAFLIDWNLAGLPAFLYLFAFHSQLEHLSINPSMSNIIYLFPFMLLVMLFPVLVVFRDMIFKGRSIGKRVFGLVVLNKNTMTEAKRWQKIVRGLFFFACQIDWVVLFSSGRTLADRVAQTIVVSKKQVAQCAENKEEVLASVGKVSGMRIALCIMLAVLWAVCLAVSSLLLSAGAT